MLRFHVHERALTAERARADLFFFFPFFPGIVVEDAPSGILAGRAAGCKVIAVCTSHTRQALLASGARPDYIVQDLTRCVSHAYDLIPDPR